MAQFINPFPGMNPERKLNEREIARAIRQSIAAEHEAVHLYEAIADSSDDKRIKTVMQDVADEEKVHAHEFQALLEMFDQDEEKFKKEGFEEVSQLFGNLSEDVQIILNGQIYLLEEGDLINVTPNDKKDKVITEAAVHRRYLLVSCNGEEDRCFSPASANDNYMLYFLERLCNSKRFNSGSYRVKIVKRIPKGCKKMSLETFLKELMPVPAKKEK